MSEFDFKVTREGAIARIDLNRPEEGNALTRAMMVRLAALLRELGSAPDINVVAIGGRGPQFCRGRDGKGESRAGMTPYQVRVKMMGAVLDSYQAVWDVPVPVIALVHGDALGYGAALLRPVFARPAAWRVLEVLVGVTMWTIALKLLLE